MKIFDFEDWELTQDTLKDILSYDPETGEFRWLVKPASRAYLGDRAGSMETVRGYWVIGIAGKIYKAHRLAWLYMYGDWPAGNLDHINRNRTDNRISNLREATKSQNGSNAVVRKEGKLKGAYWHKRGKCWTSSIGVNGKSVWLGQYATEGEAHAAYCEAAKVEFGEFFYAG